MIWDIISAHRHLTGHLTKSRVESPRIVAEVILSHVLGIDRIAIYSRFDEAVPRDKLDQVNALAKRVVRGEPLQLVVGNTQFMTYIFEVEQGVLIPRPETEGLVEYAAAQIKDGPPGDEPVILDIGTGAGVIAVSLLKLLPGARAVATDINPRALALARRNADTLGVADRLELLEGECFEPVAAAGAGPFHAVLSNPPYIVSSDIPGLDPVVRDYDPHTALDGGADGLAIIRKIVCGASAHLRAGGLFGLEVGMGQARIVAGLARDAGLDQITVVKDLSGIERCVFARKGTTPGMD